MPMSPLTPAGEQRIRKLQEELAELQMAQQQYGAQAMPVNGVPMAMPSVVDQVARLEQEAHVASKRMYELEERLARVERATSPEEIAHVLGQMVHERRANG